MRVARGKVVDGRVVLEGEPLPEGSNVTVFVEDDAEGFHLDEASLRELLEAKAHVERGNFVAADDVLRDLES
jgi:hypothetical protein